MQPIDHGTPPVAAPSNLQELRPVPHFNLPPEEQILYEPAEDGYYPAPQVMNRAVEMVQQVDDVINTLMKLWRHHTSMLPSLIDLFLEDLCLEARWLK